MKQITYDVQALRKCMEYFNANAEVRHNDHELSAFIEEWLKKFGRRKCKAFLAIIVRKSMFDGRFDRAVKEDAASMAILPNEDYERGIYSNVHRTIINGVYRKIMDIERNKAVSKGTKDGKSPKKESQKRAEHER